MATSRSNGWGRSDATDREMFQLWARYRDGTLTRLGFKRLMRPVRGEVDALLLRGAFSGKRRLVGMCRELYDHRDWLWTFVGVDGVEPTNNASERALRHAVIWRKLSFGTQSAAGSRFVETMLTVIETCRQQQRHVFAYLAEAVQARCAAKKPRHSSPGRERLRFPRPREVGASSAHRTHLHRLVLRLQGWIHGYLPP